MEKNGGGRAELWGSAAGRDCLEHQEPAKEQGRCRDGGSPQARTLCWTEARKDKGFKEGGVNLNATGGML